MPQLPQPPQFQAIATGLAFAEAPRWHDGCLWFSDFYLRQVMRVVPGQTPEVVVEVPGQPSGLGWLPNGSLLVVSMEDRRLLRLEAGGLHTAADLSPFTTTHCNDMVVDRHGRAYIGNFGFDMMNRATPRPTVLLLATPEGKVSVVADDLLFPNGCVITPDEKTLIVAETFGKRLTAFDINPDGSLANRRVWADLGDAAPDGICLDAEGAVWVASPPTAEFLRVREGGAIAERIPCAAQAIACMLGGADGRTLFMVSGRVSKAPRALAERSGRIDAVRVEIGRAGRP